MEKVVKVVVSLIVHIHQIMKILMREEVVVISVVIDLVDPEHMMMVQVMEAITQ